MTFNTFLLVDILVSEIEDITFVSMTERDIAPC